LRCVAFPFSQQSSKTLNAKLVTVALSDNIDFVADTAIVLLLLLLLLLLLMLLLLLILLMLLVIALRLRLVLHLMVPLLQC
jgi:hypothetical protein